MKWKTVEIPTPKGFPEQYRCFEVRDEANQLICAASQKNCELIASAPELLAALQDLTARCMFPAFTETAYNKARGEKRKASLQAALDAIRKAKGGVQ